MARHEVCDSCGPRSRDLSYVVPPDLDLDVLDSFANAAYGRGEADPEHVALQFLVGTYPVTPQNVKLRWAQLPSTAHACLPEFRRRVVSRCKCCYANLRDLEAAGRYQLYNKEAM